MFNFSNVLSTLKKYAVNPKVSDEKFVNSYLEIITLAAGITNKNGEEYYLNKSRVSDLMKNKMDVPQVVRAGLVSDDIDDYLKDNINSFLRENIDISRIDEIKSDLLQLAEDGNFPLYNISTESSDVDLFLNIYKQSIRASNEVSAESNILWKSGTGQVSVSYADLFKFSFGSRSSMTSITIIPMNTSFDTHISRQYEKSNRPLVSEKTIHGQWINRMIKSAGISEDELYDNIINSLKERNIKAIHKSLSENAKIDCYPIGSISIYEYNDNLFYLVSVSEFNEKNNAYGSREYIKKAIKCILTEYNESGQGYNLYMPLMGNGLSRSGISSQEAYDLIIETIKENIGLLYGEVKIVIHPKQKDAVHIGW